MKIKKWSYSRLSLYRKCPSQYEWRYILKKDVFKSTPAMERGNDIHKKAENYVNGLITGLPTELKHFKTEFKSLKRLFNKVLCSTEPDISMNYDLTKAKRKTSNWFVGFADLYDFSDLKKHNVIDVIDYKTGKMYAEHKDQGSAYSMALLGLNPKIERVNVSFWYLDQDEITDFTFERKDFKRLFNAWDRLVNRMYADKKFTATPNKFCNWCNRNIKKGGDCKGND